ncbi:MAG: hypothetical protein PHD32_00950 [Eubacteriales bacterium]|nr:hypothetical protein [Eubacteriales bacterium]
MLSGTKARAKGTRCGNKPDRFRKKRENIGTTGEEPLPNVLAGAAAQLRHHGLEKIVNCNHEWDIMEEKAKKR